MNKPELLAPAGNLEKLKMAVRFGANGVYLAGREFGLRAGAGNFSPEEMIEGVSFAHENSAKAYITVNIFAHNDDLEGLPEYLKSLREMQVDGIIVSDLGVFHIARESVPSLPIHISTQANTTNWSSVLFWKDMGASRVVLARELSLKEIALIKKRTNVELEVFVHGAMCVSYSGRCLLSNYLVGRDSNKGDCAHPCRWKYSLLEEKRPGEYMRVSEDERGTYIFNSKDLCLLEYLPDLISAGVDSFKIEGRMKSGYYGATVVKVYREAIDCYFHDRAQFYKNIPAWREELGKVSHREYTTGFLFQKPSGREHRYDSSSYIKRYDFVGLVIDYDHESGEAIIEQRNRFSVGEEVEFLPPRGIFKKFRLESMKNDRGEDIQSAPHPQQVVKVKIPLKQEPYTIIRRAKREE